jgi:hypothetical protein
MISEQHPRLGFAVVVLVPYSFIGIGATIRIAFPALLDAIAKLQSCLEPRDERGVGPRERDEQPVVERQPRHAALGAHAAPRTRSPVFAGFWLGAGATGLEPATSGVTGLFKVD